MSENLDMLSLLPGFTKRGFSEYVVHPHLALGISSFYPLTDVNDQAKSAALASGCFIMITKEYYLKVWDLGTFQERDYGRRCYEQGCQNHGWKIESAQSRQPCSNNAL